MTLAAALYAHLTADAPLTALVSNRVYPVTIPQANENAAVQPEVAYALIDRAHEYTIGAKALVLDTWSFVSVAADYDTAHQVNDALIAALDRYRGTMGGVGGVAVQTVQIMTSQDMVEDVELGLFIVKTDFEIVY